MFMVNHLVGFGVGASAYPVSHEYASQTFDGANATTYTFSGKAIGSVGARNRQVVVITGGREGATGRTVSTMTIDGVSASLVAGAAVRSETGENIRTEMWVAETNSNTTGDIVVTWSGWMFWCHVGVWAIYDAAATAYATATDTAGNGSLSINVPANGACIVGVAGGGGGGADSLAFSSLTERYDSYNGTEDCIVGGGSAEFLSAQTPLSETVTLTGTVTDIGYVAAAWGPQ